VALSNGAAILPPPRPPPPEHKDDCLNKVPNGKSDSLSETDSSSENNETEVPVVDPTVSLEELETARNTISR